MERSMSRVFRHRARGVLTVFFTLLSAVFLGFYSVLIESVRYRGAHAQAYLITDLGTTSVFAEYNTQLLKNFDLFAVDSSYGTGDFSIDRVKDRLEGYLGDNASPEEAQGWLRTDPWGIQLTQTDISAYTLLSDDGGEYFYQQAVGYLHETMISGLANKLVLLYQDSKKAESQEKDYKNRKGKSLDQQIDDISHQENERQQQLIAQQETDVAVRQENVSNPLPAIKKLLKKEPMDLLCPDGVSGQKVSSEDLCSKRKGHKGTLALDQKYGGLTDDLLFREYLMDHFSAYTDDSETGSLHYELEYLLYGHKSDRANLRSVIVRLLLIREAANYLYCMMTSDMRESALALGTALTGWTGIAALPVACQQALLVAWAFGESLLDVRTLLGGGKVPLKNDEDTWILSLSNLGQVLDLFKGDILDRGKGMDYRGYLRILLYMHGISKQKKRGLDLVELRMRKVDGESNFRADNCVIALKDQVEYSIPPLWSKVTGAFLGLMGETGTFTVDGGFSYEEQA